MSQYRQGDASSSVNLKLYSVHPEGYKSTGGSVDCRMGQGVRYIHVLNKSDGGTKQIFVKVENASGEYTILVDALLQGKKASGTIRDLSSASDFYKDSSNRIYYNIIKSSENRSLKITLTTAGLVESKFYGASIYIGSSEGHQGKMLLTCATGQSAEGIYTHQQLSNILSNAGFSIFNNNLYLTIVSVAK